MPRTQAERRRTWAISLGIPVLWASGCAPGAGPHDARSWERSENAAARDALERSRDFQIRIPSAVTVPLGGLAEIDVTLQGEDQNEKLDLVADASVPGLVAVAGAIPRFTMSGTLRVGALAPLALGATFLLHVTARSRSGAIVRTATSTATVVDRTGSLDPSFGGTGTFVAPGTKYSRDAFSDIQVEPDGSVLATGESNGMSGTFFRAVRVGADGHADPAFGRSRGGPYGDDGSVIVALPGRSRRATGLAIRRQSTGRIVLAGRNGRVEHIALAGLLPDGNLDPSFGDSGVRLLAPDGDEAAALSLAVAPDDALVVGGYRGRRPLIARLTPDGAPDPTFASGGYAVLPSMEEDAAAEVHGVAVDAQGRVLAVGNARRRAFLARLAQGETWGFTIWTQPPTEERTDETTARSLVLAPDGKILVGGSVRRGASRFVAVWRFLENGAPDPSFGWPAGLAMFPISGEEDPMAGFTLLPDGQIVVAVNADMGGWLADEHAKPYLLRLTARGWPDPAFAPGGFVRIPLGSGNVVESIDRAADGKLLLGLRLAPDERGGRHAALARVWD